MLGGSPRRVSGWTPGNVKLLLPPRQSRGNSRDIRNFATVDSALDIMEDNILAESDRSEIEQELARHKGYFLATPERPEDGYKEIAFLRYSLAPID